MPRVIVFSLLDTLLDLQALNPYFERFFGDPAVQREWFTQTLQLMMASALTNAYEDFTVEADRGLEMTARRYKVSLLGEEKNLILNGLLKLRPYSEVPPSIQRLREAGLRLAILTNLPVRAAEAQLASAGLRDHFEQVISADEIRCFKPAPEVYYLAANHLSVEPVQMRLVTSHDWDAAGAMHTGCAAAFVARPGQVMNPFGPQPDVKGAHLAEVAEQILALESAQA